MSDWEGAHAIIAEAVEITAHDRNDAYSPPEDNFANIALAWTALLRARGIITDALTPGDVARMMTALKLVRDGNAPRRDNRVDALGYVICLERAEPTV